MSFLHVFPYSRRPGTPAAGMPDQVPAGSKSERAGLLRKLDADLRRYFYAANLGRVLRILVERRRADGMLEGFSENYILWRALPALRADSTAYLIESMQWLFLSASILVTSSVSGSVLYL